MAMVETRTNTPFATMTLDVVAVVVAVACHSCHWLHRCQGSKYWACQQACQWEHRCLWKNVELLTRQNLKLRPKEICSKRSCQQTYHFCQLLQICPSRIHVFEGQCLVDLHEEWVLCLSIFFQWLLTWHIHQVDYRLRYFQSVFLVLDGSLHEIALVLVPDYLEGCSYFVHVDGVH